MATANLTNLEELIPNALEGGVYPPADSVDNLEAATKSLAKAVKKKSRAIEWFFCDVREPS